MERRSETSVNVLMGSVAGVNDTEMHIQERMSWETTCWGCGLRVVLPKFESMFKCGWCGAITMEKPEMKPMSPWSGRCSKGPDRVIVGLVLLVIFSIVCGVWSIFPVLFSTATVGSYIHSTITAVLSFNTLFNYCMAAFSLAGPSPTIEWGKHDLIEKQSLEGYKFCEYCKMPKPPNARHCRSCQSCVVDMDHHCPFIGNCVGSNNHQYFLLFLLFATVSGLYVIGLLVCVAFKVWPNLMRLRHSDVPRLYIAVSLNVIGNWLTSMILGVEPVVSMRASALFNLFIASMLLAIGVGLLLYNQVQLVLTGLSYIESLSSSGGDYGGDLEHCKSWANFKKVFGNRHPSLWLLPRSHSQCVTFSRKIHMR